MAPPRLKEAIQHVTQHARVIDARSFYRALKLIGDIMGKAFVGDMLRRRLLAKQLYGVAFLRPVDQPGHEEMLMQNDMSFENRPKGGDHRRYQNKVQSAREFIGYVLKEIAKAALPLMLVPDLNEQVLGGFVSFIDVDHGRPDPETD